MYKTTRRLIISRQQQLMFIPLGADGWLLQIETSITAAGCKTRPKGIAKANGAAEATTTAEA